MRTYGIKPQEPAPKKPGVLGSAVLLVLMAVVTAFAVYACSAHAHDHQHADLSAWYATLQNSNGVPCCDGSEATRIQDVDWQSACKDNECHYQVFIGNQWWDVPEWAVVKGPNKNGVTLVWPIYYWRDGRPENGLSSVFIRCFMPGAGG